MENLYSTSTYQDISEIKNSKSISLNLFETYNREDLISGIQIKKELYFGTYAPFWLPNFLIKNKDLKKLEEYLDELIIKNKKNKISSISIKLAPELYSENIIPFSFLLEKKKFKKSSSSLWQAIKLKNFNNKNDYIASLPHSSKKILNKYNENDFHLNEINLFDEKKLESSYGLINNNRKKIGRNLKYSFKYLKKLVSTEKERIKVFDLLYQRKHVASAICHITAKDVLYIANWGDYGHSNKYSVMYNFCLELIKLCIEKKIKILDFGLSAGLKEKNFNLFRFKKKLGCTTYSQSIYKIKL
jgi:hypothetical protein